VSNGVIMVACADGDQMHDVYNYQCNMCATQRATPRIHTLALNGGALLLSPMCPLTQERHEGAALVNHIAGAKLLKNITSLALYSHAPCGAAGLANMSIRDQIRELLAAATHIQESVDAVSAMCYFHVDWGHGRKRTYAVAQEQAIAWLQT
jgi:hypothetical protein